jgi:hypothetical protein
MSKLTVKDLGIEGKIFCISMQRNGTSSVGDFLEQYGLTRIGSPVSNKNKWPLYWLYGDFDSIISSSEFLSTDVFEDDPWWFPEFYRYIYHNVPGSRFILLDRDSDSWFKSMITHSNGYTPGITEIHAKIYRRENDYYWLKDNISKFGGKRNQEMVLYDKAGHYKAVYEQYNQGVKDFFEKKAPESLFYAELGDKELWTRLAEWLNLPTINDAKTNVHTHKSRGEYIQDYLLMKREK